MSTASDTTSHQNPRGRDLRIGGGGRLEAAQGWSAPGRPCRPVLVPAYQRGVRRGPALPGAFATLTMSFRPSKDCSFSFWMAAWASASVDIATKPKPRESPDIRSVMTAADSTVPHWAKCCRSVSEVVEYERPPT